MDPQPIRVLLIQGSPGDARLIRALLTGEDAAAPAPPSFELEWVDQLTAAWERLAAGEYDAILLDLALPSTGGQGLDALARTRALAPQVPVIVVTELDDDDFVVQAVRAGAQDCLVKSRMRRPELVRAIRCAIARQRATTAARHWGQVIEPARAQEEQRHAFLWDVLESLPHPFYVINAADRTIEMANSATGLFSPWAERVTCHALTHQSRVPCTGTAHVCPLEQVQQTKKPVIVEHVHHDRDGNARSFEVHGYPVFDDAGQVIQMIVYSLDITERKQAEATLQQRSRDLQLLNRLGQELGTSLDLAQVLAGVLRASHEVVAAAGSAVWLWDEKQPGWLVCRAADPDAVHSLASRRLRPGEGIAGWVAQHGESAIVPCVSEDRRCALTLDVHIGFQTHSVLAVPLRARDAVIGVLEVVNKSSGDFEPHDGMLLETLAAGAAIAIENARLHDQAQQVAVATERSHLARDLHDAVTQALFSASLIADVLPRLWERNPVEGRQRLEELRELTRGALAEMRTLLLELRPAALLDTELGELLHQLAEGISSRTRIPVVVTVEGRCSLPPDVHIALYHIVQEALNNIAKHAGASQVTVSLDCASPGPPSPAEEKAKSVRLRIRDDGRGFDPSQVPAGHLGLGIMRERAESIGATFQIESQIGQGTQVEVNWSNVQPAPGEEEP